MKPHALVTNDDGIESKFLHRLVDALSSEFQISVAAPTSEQSWIGRAISRRKEIEVTDRSSVFSKDIKAWALNGTPTDCVNIALGNLVERPVDIVLSGINIGYNTSESLILSSGTIGGATEGAFWGLRAIAFSQSVPFKLFENIRKSDGRTEGAFTNSIVSSAKHACQIALKELEKPAVGNVVLNVNFPEQTKDDTPHQETVPAKVQLGSLYRKNNAGNYEFHYSEGKILEKNEYSDRSVLERGHISCSLLDFSQIGINSAKSSQPV